jgi:nitrogen fixation protein NifQ
LSRAEPEVTINPALNLLPSQTSINVAPELDPGGCELSGAAAHYRTLTGFAPEEAAIENDQDFDRHVFACILALALSESGGVGQRSGLGSADLDALFGQWFLQRKFDNKDNPDDESECYREEIGMVRDLLLANRSSQGDAGRWLAAMMARRAMEPNHLWEDLGLRDRSELTRLLERHFRPLAERNDKNMRWKRFFYRAMCESDGFVMCSTPVCANCADYDLCFGQESGESRLTSRRVRKD